MHRYTCIQFRTDFSSYSIYIGISHLAYFFGTMRMILHYDILQSNWISHSVYTEPPSSMGTSIIYVLGGTRARPEISEGPRYEGRFYHYTSPDLLWKFHIAASSYICMSLIFLAIRGEISLIKNLPHFKHSERHNFFWVRWHEVQKMDLGPFCA